MTFQSKILRTKKKSFEDRWLYAAVLLGFFGLLPVLTFALRAVTLPGSYGVVPVEIPVVQAALTDPAFNKYREETRDSLSRNTPTVILTTDAFFFGELESFTTGFSDINNKYVIRHVEGTPQLESLLRSLSSWVVERAHNDNIPLGKVLVFVPSGDIPMPIVIEVIAGLRSSPHFQRVILSNGIM